MLASASKFRYISGSLVHISSWQRYCLGMLEWHESEQYICSYRSPRAHLHPWAMHQCALCIFTKSGALSNKAKHSCIAHAGYFDKLQDNKHLRENPTNLREKPYCLLPQLTVSIFLNLLIPKNNPDFFENNQATACTEYLANTPPMGLYTALHIF